MRKHGSRFRLWLRLAERIAGRARAWIVRRFWELAEALDGSPHALTFLDAVRLGRDVWNVRRQRAQVIGAELARLGLVDKLGTAGGSLDGSRGRANGWALSSLGRQVWEDGAAWPVEGLGASTINVPPTDPPPPSAVSTSLVGQNAVCMADDTAGASAHRVGTKPPRLADVRGVTLPAAVDGVPCAQGPMVMVPQADRARDGHDGPAEPTAPPLDAPTGADVNGACRADVATRTAYAPSPRVVEKLREIPRRVLPHYPARDGVPYSARRAILDRIPGPAPGQAERFDVDAWRAWCGRALASVPAALGLQWGPADWLASIADDVAREVDAGARIAHPSRVAVARLLTRLDNAARQRAGVPVVAVARKGIPGPGPDPARVGNVGSIAGAFVRALRQGAVGDALSTMGRVFSAGGVVVDVNGA